MGKKKDKLPKGGKQHQVTMVFKVFTSAEEESDLQAINKCKDLEDYWLTRILEHENYDSVYCDDDSTILEVE